MVTQDPPAYGERQSVDTYLVQERRAEYKSDYVYGAVRAMSGGSYRHGAITANVMGAVVNHLRGKRCQAVSGDVKVEADPDGLYVYPDVTVVCEEPRFLDTHRDVLANPTVVVEVLSPSTEAYDRGLKSLRYRSMASLREFLLISQEQPVVERFVRRDDGLWYIDTIEGLDGTVNLTSIGCTVPMTDVYDRIAFDTE